MYTVLAWFIFNCIGRLPLGIRQKAGSALGYLIAQVPTREKEIAWLHLKILRITPHPERTIQEMFANLGRSIMESLNPKPLIDSGKVSFSTESQAQLETLIASKRGILALTAHSGNWDLLGAYFASMGLPIHTVGRSSRNPFVQHLMEELRERCGVHTIWRDAVSGVKRIIALFKAGGILAALIDQDTQVHSTFVPFFGVAAKTPVSLIEIAKRNNAAICVVLMARTAKDQYTISLSVIPDDYSADAALAFYHRTLEEHLKLYPSQWVWFHKRWRSTPNGTTRGGKDYINALKKGEIALRFTASMFLATVSGCSWNTHPLDHLHKAEEHAEAKRYDNAIAEYRLHMEAMSTRSQKEQWENPSFYRLIIGDLHLQRSLPDEAIKEYLLAEKEGIQPESISYRLREVAKWYQQRGDLDKAFELLNRYRSRDPLLFNALLDEIVRERTKLQFENH